MIADRRRSDEVPEADSLEQTQAVDEEPRPSHPSRAHDAPEADAIEQAQEVPLDDSDER